MHNLIQEVNEWRLLIVKVICVPSLLVIAKSSYQTASLQSYTDIGSAQKKYACMHLHADWKNCMKCTCRCCILEGCV